MKDKYDLVLLSDPHIRSDVPRCRNEEEFHPSMLAKLEFIKDLCNKHKCPLICTGDIGHHPAKSWSIWLIERVISIFKDIDCGVYAVPGQHDLPNHNIEDIRDSAFGILMQAGVIHQLSYIEPVEVGNNILLYGFPFGSEFVNLKTYKNHRNVAVIHKMIIQDKELWPGQTDPKANLLLKKHNYDLIVSGDNHQAFTEEYKGKLLVNCGSMMRQRSDQIDFQPRVYLWNAEKNSVKIEYLPIDKAAVSSDFVKTKKEENDRMEALVSSLKDDTKAYEAGLDFEKNTELHVTMNKVSPSVMSKIEEAITEGRK